MIVKYVQPDRSGIQAHNFTRHSIGYVVRGKKCVYYGDVCHEIPQGTLFYMGMGNHYTEDVPEQGKNFEQIVFYYTSDQLSRILNHLSVGYQLNITNDHSCPNCENQSHVSYPASNIMKNFFGTVNQYLKDDAFSPSISHTLSGFPCSSLIDGRRKTESDFFTRSLDYSGKCSYIYIT